MYDFRPFANLGQFENDWLKARYHFSFSNYYDPAKMGVGPLRVWNDDTIRAGTGFPPHGHRDMEIITYVRHGAISHRDSFGNAGRTAAGEVQVMSAGSGIQHSEVNREDEDTTLFQIWIEPNARNLTPRWEARSFPEATGGNGLIPLVSGQSIADTMTIAQDATLFAGTLGAGGELSHVLGQNRLGYLVATVGSLEIGGVKLEARDGIAISDLDTLAIKATQDAQFVLADLPR